MCTFTCDQLVQNIEKVLSCEYTIKKHKNEKELENFKMSKISEQQDLNLENERITLI